MFRKLIFSMTTVALASSIAGANGKAAAPRESKRVEDNRGAGHEAPGAHAQGHQAVEGGRQVLIQLGAIQMDRASKFVEKLNQIRAQNYGKEALERLDATAANIDINSIKDDKSLEDALNLLATAVRKDIKAEDIEKCTL